MKRACDAARAVVRVVLLSLVAGALATMPARAADPVPEFYGFYALDNGRLTELKASSSNWPNVSATIRFVEFGKGVGAAASDTHLSRLVFLRAKIDPDSATPERMENRWYRSSNVSRDMELRTKPVVGQPEMIMLVPREALTNGVYSVVRGDSVIATFYVNRDAVLTNLQESEDCVDHVYEGMDGEQFSWDKFDERMAGQHQTILCSQSKLEGMARQSSVGSAAAYENCLSVGNKPESCEKQYRPAPAKAGAVSQASDTVALDRSVAGNWVGEMKVVGKGWASCGVVLKVKQVAIGQVAGVLETQQGGAPYMDVPVLLTDALDGQFGLTWNPPIRCHRRGGSCSECTFQQIRLTPLGNDTAKAVATTRSLSFEGTLSRR